MANLLDYLDWRGDLTLNQAPFNEVDNLVLAELSYLNFQGIVPGPRERDSVTIAQAAKAVFADGRKPKMGVIVPDEVPDMLEKLANCPRFSHMKLSGYVDHVDQEEGEQFAALVIETGDRHIYVSYRGTDDTLAGWREDLELACAPQVPAQSMALDYLLWAARRFPRRGLRLGGHSKGGNLAVYAGVFCNPLFQRRITEIWSNDGPGFNRDILNLPEHRRVADRIHTIVPKSSVVGMLLEHEETYTVVDSDHLGLWQHDGFSWQVMGDHFITLPQLGEQAAAGSLAIREWVHSMPAQRRSQFVKALFDVLTASGAETLTDLKEDSLKAVVPMLKAMKDMDKETREGIWDFLQLVLVFNTRMVLEDVQQGAKRWGESLRSKKT